MDQELVVIGVFVLVGLIDDYLETYIYGSNSSPINLS